MKRLVICAWLLLFASAGHAQLVIENPIDARPQWQRQGGGRRESGETRYRQGVYYACALLAVPDGVPVLSYPVKGRKGQRGWMGSRTHAVVVQQMQAMAKHLDAPDDLSDHCLMALGVACVGLADWWLVQQKGAA